MTGLKSLLQRDGESATEVAAPEYGAPEIFNFDQGSRYTAKEHIGVLEKHGIAISMNGKGRSNDSLEPSSMKRSISRGMMTSKSSKQNSNVL